MPHQISLSATTGTPPYSVTVCDESLVYCYLLTGSTSLSATTTFTVPPPLDVANSIIIKIIDNSGCQRFYRYDCPPTPPDCLILSELDEFILSEDDDFLTLESCITITPTPTPTPIGTCRCIQITNTGTTGGTFYYTQCDGTITAVLPINSGTTLYYCGTNPVALTECTIYIGDNCVSNSCVAITPTPTPTLSPPPVLCGYFDNENISLNYFCNLSYSTYTNGKPVYPIFLLDCTTWSSTYVFWNNLTNRWEHTNGVILFSYNNNPGMYPQSSLTYPWVTVFPGAIQFRILSTNFNVCSTPTPTPSITPSPSSP